MDGVVLDNIGDHNLDERDAKVDADGLKVDEASKVEMVEVGVYIVISV